MISDNDRLRALATPGATDGAPAVPLEPERTPHPILVFRVGMRLFGVEVHHVYEVVVSGSVTSVPMARPFVLGITLVRGRLVPVISLGELLGIPGGDGAAPTLPRLLVLREGALEIALVSDTTLGIFDLDLVDVGSPGGARPDYIARELAFQDELIFLLAVPHLLRTVTGDEAPR